MAWISEWWNQVSETVLHGLNITVAGMTLVFFTLGLVILAMVLLTRLPWLRAQEEPEEEQEVPAAVVPAAAVEQLAPRSADCELAEVAAIAVALLRGRRRPSRSYSNRGARGAWKAYGRANQLGL